MSAQRAYISRIRCGGGVYRLQLITFASSDGYSDILAEVDMPEDQVTISLAEVFLYDLADAKGFAIKSRRGNDD